jgi:hypothetical protein
MYKQLTSTESTQEIQLSSNPRIDELRQQEKKLDEGKKGWKTMNNDFGGSSFSKSPGSAAAQQQTMRKANYVVQANSETLRR